MREGNDLMTSYTIWESALICSRAFRSFLWFEDGMGDGIQVCHKVGISFIWGVSYTVFSSSFLNDLYHKVGICQLLLAFVNCF